MKLIGLDFNDKEVELEFSWYYGNLVELRKYWLLYFKGEISVYPMQVNIIKKKSELNSYCAIDIIMLGRKALVDKPSIEKVQLWTNSEEVHKRIKDEFFDFMKRHTYVNVLLEYHGWGPRVGVLELYIEKEDKELFYRNML